MSVQPKPSGTVVVLRDGREHLEVLLLERSRSRGTWVFPGGKVEEADRSERSGDAQELARHAALREALEEAGLALSAPALLPISRWITPEPSTSIRTPGGGAMPRWTWASRLSHIAL